jgi:hypothetical protein
LTFFLSRSRFCLSQIGLVLSQIGLVLSQIGLRLSQAGVSLSQTELCLSQVGLLSRERSREMTLKVSVGELLETLERKIAFHREQAALHAREEELHHSQRTLHEAELESATRHFEALEAAALPAAEVALSAPDHTPAVLPGPEEDDEDVGSNPPLRALISRILKDRTDGEPFGPTAITAEINRRFRDRLDQDADVRNVSAALRRMCRKRQIQAVREGRSYREALYAKDPSRRG